MNCTRERGIKSALDAGKCEAKLLVSFCVTELLSITDLIARYNWLWPYRIPTIRSSRGNGYVSYLL